MITTFNGNAIFELLKNRESWTLSENNRVKYSIKKGFSSETMTLVNQEIDVLLPFSAGTYYREYLVNYDHVKAVFQNEGFVCVISDGFDSMLRLYKKQNKEGYGRMSQNDKDYVSLYSYLILQKV